VLLIIAASQTILNTNFSSYQLLVLGCQNLVCRFSVYQ